MDNYIEVVAGAASVPTEEAFLVRLINCALKLHLLIPELATHVDICSLGFHTEAYHESTFDKFVGVVAHNFSVFASARF